MRSDTLAIHGGAPVHAGDPIPLSVVSWDEREKEAIERVFQSGKFCSVYDEALEVKSLEQEFARYVEARHAVVGPVGIPGKMHVRKMDMGDFAAWGT